MGFEGSISVDLEDQDAEPRSDWGKYVQGVALVLGASGYRLPGADLMIASDIPRGSGLSSSAAFEVAVGFALVSLAGLSIEGMQLARIGQVAEHKYACVMSGIMDQFASVHGQTGRALFLDCRSLEWSPIPLGDAAFVICNTKVKHDLAQGEYNTRRSECRNAAEVLGKPALRDVSLNELPEMPSEMPENLKKRTRHVVTENARVFAAVSALNSSDLNKLGALIDSSHESLRDDFEVSCEELDTMVSIARKQPGLLGARMMGGGFGGCTINLVLAETRSQFISNVGREYLKKTGIVPEIYEANVANGVEELIG
jgi:galactokinase